MNQAIEQLEVESLGEGPIPGPRRKPDSSSLPVRGITCLEGHPSCRRVGFLAICRHSSRKGEKVVILVILREAVLPCPREAGLPCLVYPTLLCVLYPSSLPCPGTPTLPRYTTTLPVSVMPAGSAVQRQGGILWAQEAREAWAEVSFRASSGRVVSFPRGILSGSNMGVWTRTDEDWIDTG